jgi:hypothetical protein
VDNVPKDTYELVEINQHSSDSECLLAQQHKLLWNKDKFLEIFPAHLLMGLDKQNMAKTSFKLAASESCGDVCATECLLWTILLVVTMYVSPNTPSDDWKSLIFYNLAGYFPKVGEMFKFLAKERL